MTTITIGLLLLALIVCIDIIVKTPSHEDLKNRIVMDANRIANLNDELNDVHSHNIALEYEIEGLK